MAVYIFHMARLRKKLPFPELGVPWKMLKGRIINRGQKMPPWRERKVDNGELRLVDGVPVVRVRGNPGCCTTGLPPCRRPSAAESNLVACSRGFPYLPACGPLCKRSCSKIGYPEHSGKT